MGSERDPPPVPPPTAENRQLLAFLAEHRVVLAAHLRVLLGLSAGSIQRRLRMLGEAGLVESRRLYHYQPACYAITARGLRCIESELPRPQLNMQGYVHDMGAAWLWLAARSGAFGRVEEVLSERQLRSRDGLPRSPDAGFDPRGCTRFGVRLWELGPGGAERLHYPDLLLRAENGWRVALELELSSKSSRRLERILTAYAGDPRVDAVVYVVSGERLAGRITEVAARAGAGEKVFVRRFQWTPGMDALATQLDHVSTRGRATSRGRGARAGARQGPEVGR